MNTTTIKPLILSFIFFTAFAPLRGNMLLQPNDIVAINGDSITAQVQYSRFIEEYLLACEPVRNIRFINIGSGGATTGFLDGRIEGDVLPFKPTVATIFFNTNDAHNMPITKENRDAYRQGLTSALKKLKGGGVKRIFIASPGCVDPAYYNSARYSKDGSITVTGDGLNETLRDMGDIACEIAKEDGDIFVDAHSSMLSAMTKMKAVNGPYSFFTPGDGVHPPPIGHLPTAYAFLKAFGCDGAIGTITVDVAANQAEGTPGHKIISVKDGSVTIESTRYPFCFVKCDHMERVLPYLPFNEELNRYLLIVKGLKSAKAKVTWGTESKEFAAADLEKGINLADKFLINPFCEKFDQLQTAVTAKQGTESDILGYGIHNVGSLKRADPAHSETINELVPSCLNLDKKLSDVVSVLVTPVTHTIRIEPIL